MFFIKKKTHPALKSKLGTTERKKNFYGFGINQRIRLIAKNNQQTSVFQTTIQDVFDDSILVLYPEYKKESINFPKNKLSVEIYEERGIYSFESNIIAVHKGRVPMLEIKKPLKIKRSQRRGYKRCNAVLDIIYSISPERYPTYMPYLHKKCRVQTKNISASGLCIVAGQEIPRGMVCDLAVYMPNRSRPLGITAVVLASNRLAVGHKFSIRMRFVEITSKERMFIDDFVKAQII